MRGKEGSFSGSNDSPPKPPRYGIYLVLYLFFGLFLYTTYSLRISIPNEPKPGTTQTLFYNEGGENCFAYNSTWNKLQYKEKHVQNIHDIFELGGATIKVKLEFDDGKEAIWKPQLRKSKGHVDSAFFEVIYFHLDCLLGLRRTPPAASFILETERFRDSLVGQSVVLLRERMWYLNMQNGYTPGVAQDFIYGMYHLNLLVEKFGQYIIRLFDFFHITRLVLGISDYSLREYSQREMIDYLLANWDISHNQFYAIDPVAGNTVLVYLDHNHLRLTKKRAFGLKICKFWYHNVERLISLMNDNLELTLRQSLQRERIFEFGTEGKFEKPLKNINKRAKEYMDHVSGCIETYGFEYVFGFPLPK